jgi:Domain of unknown function (DUF4878)
MQKLLLSIACIFVFTCCKTEQKPETVAVEFLNHMVTFDVEKMSALSDDKTKQMLTSMNSIMGLSGKDMKAEMKKEMGDKKVVFDIIKTDMKGDTATVTYIAKDADEKTKPTEKPKESKLKLIKVNNVWKVSMAKEDMAKEGANSMGDESPIEPDSTSTN